MRSCARLANFVPRLAHCGGVALLLVACLQGAAQQPVRIDASATGPAPVPVKAQLGSSRSPKGEVLGVNSQYLTRDGQPWVPVMGEFHFSRYPEAQWEQEILKMKAAGVDIVSTYVIWIHHEQVQGQFDWEGQRNLRKFTQTCAKHGIYVYPRIGPWAHAEVRNGGIPDWVLKNGPTRRNDPVYLKEVDAFYKQIGKQLQGLLWKDGGPVIGIQVENEYRAKGAGQGAEHLHTLKQMAIADGMDVPLYTVTGWDGASIPLDAVLPVFGGYPDAPWDASPHKLAANEVYAFRFNNRSAGNMGAIGTGSQNSATAYAGTPFLTAEVGDGIEDTYFRRPVVSVDDVASIAPVMLGSGANLLGYYMFHGGRNPEAEPGDAITLQESQRTNYPTDVPEKSYDFQAPLGEFGQERGSLRRLKLVHYFLADFGSVLAPMQPHAPAELPAERTDLTVPRVSARTLGQSGFVFFNNHVRGAAMPERSGFQIALKLPSGEVRVPESAIALPADSYGIWPVNFALGGTNLRYATAQLFKRVVTGGRTYYFFFAMPGVVPEFLVDLATAPAELPKGVEAAQVGGGTRLRFDPNAESVVALPGGVSVVVLPEARAEQVWRGDDASTLLASAADAFSDGSGWTLQTTSAPTFRFGVFGGAAPRGLDAVVHGEAAAPVFAEYSASVSELKVEPVVSVVHAATTRPQWQMGPELAWRKHPLPMAPATPEFEHAGEWSIKVPAVVASANVADVFLSVKYEGDVARLSDAGRLLDDNFWNGVTWEVGLREVGELGHAGEVLRLQVLPLPQEYPMYLEGTEGLRFSNGVAGSLDSVKLVPQYQMHLVVPGAR